LREDIATTQSVSENEDILQHKKLHRSRKIICFGLFGFGVFVLLIVAISLFFLLRNESILHNYQIYATLEDRPQWWIKAMNEVNILRTQGASPLVIGHDDNKKYMLWVFGPTSVNTTEGIRNFSNAAMFVVTDRRNSSVVTDASFLREMNSSTELRPLISLTSTEQQQKMQIVLLGSIFVSPRAFLYFELLNQNNVHVAYGLLSCTFQNGLNCSRVFANNTVAPVAPNALILQESDAFIYAYVLRDRFFNDSKNEVYVARLPNDGQAIFDSSMPYKFLKEADLWQNWESARPIAYDNGATVDITWCSFLKSYVMLDSGFNNTLRLRTASHPYGRWSDVVHIYTYPTFGTLRSAYFHPEFFEDEDRVMYISFSVSNDSFERYPQWLKVVFRRKSNGGIL
jgi:hypothetical protein